MTLLIVEGGPIGDRRSGRHQETRAEIVAAAWDEGKAGFAIIEAATIEEAIQLAAGTPCAVAQGVVEVWPVGD